ncbi:SDR family NAD(P)-dependent oxidoreductase [Micromonospora sp. WMMD729]|uniref:type I polyketide synthase n=1 Tax=Micromonospora sp. WMMD729 TaxID=3404127 RepID=UPI003BF5252C
MTSIAVVGMACRYPDARSPQELWENAVAGRRAFRRLPDVRMNSADYFDADPAAPDRFYARNAAVIEGYEFDRVGYKVAGSTYRSTDLAHWLALETAATALADAGFPAGEGLPQERTGVIVGNTLTGEFSRANQIRLRWPYVRRTVAAALRAEGWDDEKLSDFLATYEQLYKSPFPPVNEDTLAGALSNTIAGRICNHFDLKGGGYTVDGACSSSLLSVVTACRALLDGDLDVAVAGGVDLSIDPFEVIGFAKTGALASGEMRVYDRASNGFWPGEGCGMLVLMRADQAAEAGHRIYASVAGWGVSSDGRGGITRPEVDGYQLALRRAYGRAGFGIDTVGLFEGHGTGTKVGDTTELTALSSARATANPDAPPAVIGSVKGMIGHTKAAAGVAGFIRAAMAVHHEVLPPSVGSVDPHEILTGDGARLRTLRKAEAWPSEVPVRAGITAMGFGGINTHVVLERHGPRRSVPDRRTRTLATSAQDAELLLVDAASAPELADRLAELSAFVTAISYAELSDLAAALHRDLRDRPFRAAVVASSPEEATRLLTAARDAVESGETSLIRPDGRFLLGHVGGPARISFLFPGQGSGRGVSGGALRRRFAEVEDVYLRAALPTGSDVVATEVAQPRIVTGSLAGQHALSMLGIQASTAIGHSLGEIVALQWAGVMDEETLLRVAGVRGRTMAGHSQAGTMADIGAPPETVDGIIAGLPVVVAAYNGPEHTVVSGSVDAIEAVCHKARTAGLSATRLRVSHAFHSPLVAPAADTFADALADERFHQVGARVVSTVTGEPLPARTDVPGLLRRQITDPVLFHQAVALAAKNTDLFVEVGPGQVLTGLATTVTDVPAVAVDTDNDSLASLLRVAGAAYVLGAAPAPAALFDGRFVRPLEIGAEFSFLTSPCEQAPELDSAIERGSAVSTTPTAAVEPAGVGQESTEDLMRRLTAERAELPIELVRPDSRLLDDLHLSSITIGQVANQLAQRLQLPPAQMPVNFATATVRELAETMDTLARTARDSDAAATPQVAGVAAWARPWRVDLDEVPLPAVAVDAAGATGPWHVHAAADHPFATALATALERAGLGGGVLVCLPPDCTEEQLAPALRGAQQALATGSTRFVLVGHGRGAAAIARTLHLEAPSVLVTVVHLADTGDAAVEQVVREVAATTSFTEVHHDDGVRRVPTLRAMPVRPATTVSPLGADDVLLVTGGGKGITAECALALASDSGASLAVLGRSDPAQDTELAGNLARIAAAGVRVRYARADVTDAAAVARAVRDLSADLGPVTAVLHGAGRNDPAGLASLDEAAFRRTFAPKIDGLRAVLDAVDASRLRLLVTLGSIIGRAGLRGEAHYATANDWLAEETTAFAQAHPDCRTLCLEWSVWSGVGMGERLSVVESLSRDGVTPITPDQGIAILRRLVADTTTPTVVVISGRTEGIHTVRYHQPALPLLRFVDRALVRYHQVELVVETELNVGTDRYLEDHDLDGNLLFPAVFGMEAMTQVAAALSGADVLPVIEQAEFLRPIVVAPHGHTRIRVAALVTDDDVVEVAIRSEETGFTADHFTARLRLGADTVPDGPPDQVPDGLAPVALTPLDDLYGGTLFQGGRFQRLRQYHRAAARHVDAVVQADDTTAWFAPYVSGTLLLGDPGVRDALMHGNQVCVPDATLLPVGVERIHPGGEKLSSARELRYCATERERDGDTYVYDIALRTESGVTVERWEGLRLRAVRKQDGAGPWVPPLLGSFLERGLGDLGLPGVAVAIAPDAPPADPDPASPEGGDHLAVRRRDSANAVGQALGRPVEIRYRPDGRPEVDGEHTVSIAHGAGVTLAVAGTGVLGCDLESVARRSPEEWQGLLGPHAALADLLVADLDEDADTAATRVWTAVEAMQKAGLPMRGPLVLGGTARPGWVLFAAGGARAASFVTSLRGVDGRVVITVLAGAEG